MKLRLPSFYLACSASLILLLVFRDVLSGIHPERFFHEGRSIEFGSAMLLLMAAALWVGLRPDGADRSNWHLPVILTLMGLRELDFDKRFTAEGVMQLRLYTGDSPLLHKLVGAGIIALILVCAWRLMRLNLRPWWQGLLRGVTSSWLILGAGGLLVVAKTMDGLDRKLADIGIQLEPGLVPALGRAEELLELVMCMTVVQAVAYYANRNRGLALS